MREYYKLLGIESNASQEEIKKAFRRKALECHPDMHPGDPEAEKKFKSLNMAYEVLGDPDKRAQYDQFGEAAFEGGAGASQGHGFGNFGGDFSDIFNDLFGGAAGFQQRRSGGMSSTKGPDLQYNISISLEEAHSGVKIPLSYHADVGCSSCGGSGSASKAKPVQCSACNGTGYVRKSGYGGFVTVETTCETCYGERQILPDPCKKCNGSGRTRDKVDISVVIPAGIDDSCKVRVGGRGGAGLRGGKAGDLYVAVKVKKHDFFLRQGNDLICEVPVTIVMAALGGEIRVPLLGGPQIMVKLPAGTQNGDKLRVQGKGMQKMNQKSCGDLFVKVAIETPVKLTKRQKELLEEFQEISKKEVGCNPKAEGFFDKMKDFWPFQ